MDKHRRKNCSLRRSVGLILIVAALTATWAWGEVARLAEPAAGAGHPPAVALYAAWQPDGVEQASLFRSTDEGLTWQALSLPVEGAPAVWADDGGSHVAVATGDGSLLWSEDQGDSWIVVDGGLSILSLTWGDDGSLYLGTEGRGVYRLADDGALVASSLMAGELASTSIVGLSLVEGRLFAATPAAVSYTDDTDGSADQAIWSEPAPLPDQATVLAAADRQTVYVGLATTGVAKSSDAGQTWQPAWEGLGLAAGQMVRATALRVDPQVPELVYATVDHLVGGSQVHASAAGAFVTLDGGALWQPLTGPSFPEASQASALVLAPGRSLYAQAVTARGLQAYAPDMTQVLAALESDDAKARAAAARQLGLTRPAGVWEGLLAALDDPEPAVSLAASRALGQIADPASVPGLFSAIEHPSEQVRVGAARALGMMGVEAAVEPLRAMLLRGQGLEVTVAGEALGRIGGTAATDALLVALADEAATARWHVAMAALEEMGEPAVGSLVAMLGSRDAYARRNAAEALGWVGSASATEALAEALKGDGDAAVRSHAAWALGEIGSPAARRALERAQRRDLSAEVQTEATRALARLPERQGGAWQTLTSWTASWAPALSQLQPVRWLILALSLAGGAWLMMGHRCLEAVPLRLRFRQH